VIVDNNWNTVWFYHKPVTGTPEKFALGKRHASPHLIWDHMLQEYLETEGKTKE
jgi:hypothetical protein